ncbi:MAG: futalosine hydrolase [Vicinamibacterales bacterium]
MEESALLVCAATESEADILRIEVRDDRRVRVIHTGVGPVNAAHAVTLAIVEERPKAIIICGVGGAYPESGLEIGDVVCAEVEIYGDLGAQSPNGFLDMKALGFPVVSGSGAPLFNQLPMQLFPVDRRVPFVTVSTCTGTSEFAHELVRRTGGAVENMEGAAIAHVAHLHGIPVGEVRGISNMVTNRDSGTWKLKEAAEAAQHALLNWQGLG